LISDKGKIKFIIDYIKMYLHLASISKGQIIEDFIIINDRVIELKYRGVSATTQ